VKVKVKVNESWWKAGGGRMRIRAERIWDIVGD